MLLLAVAGISCQLLLLQNAIFSQQNQATIAFTTPTNVAPSNLLMCFNSTSVQLNPLTFSVVALTENGQNLTITPLWQASPFFLPTSTSIGLNAAQFGTVRDVTATDDFFAGSYFTQRLDNLWRDWQDQSISGLVDFRDPRTVSSPVTNSQDVTGNCVLLSGSWSQGALYELSFTFRNPPNPGSPNALQPMPAIWVAPVTATVASVKLSSGITYYEPSFAIRGNKYGAVCAARPPLDAALGTLWDACGQLDRVSPAAAAAALSAAAAASQSATSTTSTTATATGTLAVPCDADCQAAASLNCVSSLRAFAANTTGFPFNTPPLTTYTVDSWPDPPCSPGQARYPQYGGVCVNCAPGVVNVSSFVSVGKAGSTRQQASQHNQGRDDTHPRWGVAPVRLSSNACPQQPGSDGTPASTQGLAASLCTTFTNVQKRWQNGTLTAKSVTRIGLKAFQIAAQSVVDSTAISQANATFYANYVFDERHPASPTRQYGIKPSCSNCEDGPTFPNVFNGKQPVQVFDYQFDAMNTLRFIGYVLDTLLAVPCAALWDANNPREWKYGFYEDILCQPIPAKATS